MTTPDDSRRRFTLTTILVAVDVPDGTQALIDGAKSLASRFGAHIHIVHVFDPKRSDREPPRDEERDRTTLSEAVSAAFPENGGVPVEVHTFRGRPDEIILREAQRIRADAIVLGPHRSRGRSDRVLGSTAESLLRRATVPCLVLNAPFELPLKRIMVPTDFSTPARRATHAALAWSESGGERATVKLVHAAGAANLISDDEDLETDLAMEARSLSEGFDPPETRLLRTASDPAGALIDFAIRDGVGLLVMGTSGMGALGRAFLGSVSSEVLRRADFPLLLIPRRIEDQPK